MTSMNTLICYSAKCVEREETNMSGQKKIRLSFADSILDDLGPDDVILESKIKQEPTEQFVFGLGQGFVELIDLETSPSPSPTQQIVLETRRSRSPTQQIVLGTRRSRSPTEEDPSDWRRKVSNVQDRNLYALKNSILTDITLEVGSENTPFQAHKLFLALGSPVFHAMFFGPLAEQGEKITIPDIMPDAFKVLLRHLYGETAELDNELEALNVWIAADKYCVPILKKHCVSYFCNCPISSSNLWKLLESAVFLNLIPLVSRCKQYLERHTDSSLRAEGFLETKTDTVKEILNMSFANVNELVLLKSVIHWGRHKVMTGEAVSLTEALKPLLPLFRFGALAPIEFCQFLDETNDLLEEADALAILKHLTQPLNYPLPEWCCTTVWERVHASISYSRVECNQASYDSQRRKEGRKWKKRYSSHPRRD